MNDVFDRFDQGSDPWEDSKQAIGWMQEEFPMLYQYLAGRPKSVSKTGIFPGSVRLFTNAGELKAVLQGREWLFDGYLVLPKDVNVLTNMESLIQAGKIGWTARSERVDSSKKAPY